MSTEWLRPAYLFITATLSMNSQHIQFSWSVLAGGLCLVLCGIVSSTNAENIPQLKIMTEEWEPYNFKQDGTVRGIAVDMLVLMLERLGSSQGRDDIKIYPWIRAYKTLQQEPNTMLFTTIRTREREHKFKWVGPIFKTEMHVYALKSNQITIQSVEDLKQYQIGTLRGDVTEDMLVQKAGLNRADFEQVSSNIQNTKKLMLGRIDLMVHSEETMVATCQEAGFDRDAFESVFVLDKSEGYYAFHHDTSESVIALFQAAFDELKEEGTLDDIFRQYGQ